MKKLIIWEKYMELADLITLIVSFFHAHKLIVALILVVLGAWAIKKPKDFLKFIIFIMILVVVLYIVSLLGKSTFTGVQYKDDVKTKTEESIQ